MHSSERYIQSQSTGVLEEGVEPSRPRWATGFEPVLSANSMHSSEYAVSRGGVEPPTAGIGGPRRNPLDGRRGALGTSRTSESEIRSLGYGFRHSRAIAAPGGVPRPCDHRDSNPNLLGHNQPCSSRYTMATV
jgi:hypothetical protein